MASLNSSKPVSIDNNNYIGLPTACQKTYRYVDKKKCFSHPTVGKSQDFENRAKKFIRSSNQSSFELSHAEENTGLLDSTMSDRLKKQYNRQTVQNSSDVFESRWKPDQAGHMVLCVSRKSGTAHIETSLDNVDINLNIHHEKKYNHHAEDNICKFNNFVTGKTLSTMDVLKPLGNREPPTENKQDWIYQTGHQCRANNLNRCLIPKPNTKSIIPDQPSTRSRIRFQREQSHLVFNENGLVGYQPYESQICDLLPTARNPMKRRIKTTS